MTTSESFSFQLLASLEQGATIEDLAADNGISADRVELRIRAAILSLSARQADSVALPLKLRHLEPYSIDWGDIFLE